MEIQKNTKHFSFGAGTGIVTGISDFTGRTVSRNNTVKITVDTASMNMKENTQYKGLGCISANNSSRLFLDYKALHPDVYEEILNLLFKKGYGAELSHIKLELGADINSSSGTEPCTMRYRTEEADVTRGAGFIFASDALKVNPDLTIDMLRWGEPNWVKKAFDVGKEAGYSARYKWYINTIDSAYDKLGIKFTHISPDGNETDNADEEWLIYFSEHLKKETGKGYDYSKIKIVASDEVGTRTIAEKMMKNEVLRNAVDIIGLHYTTYGDENTTSLVQNYGKEVWYSEGIAPCNVSKYSINCDSNGITGKNGTLDVANRIINSYYNGEMTMYEFQPAIAGYYNGSCYAPKQIITANSPWSGYYSINSGFFMAMHFTRFVGKNWRFIDSACYGDGEENHFIENSTNNYMTLMPEDKSELTMIFCNDTAKTRGYMIDISDCNMDDRIFGVIETKPPSPFEHYAENWFRLTDVKEAVKSRIYIEIKPFSLVTLTTMNPSFVKGIDTVKRPFKKKERLELPYKDDFSYSELSENFLEERGYAPLFTTDQGGAFEVVKSVEGNYLQQKITKDIIPQNWRFRGTPDPITCLGDDSWVNYSAEIEFMLDDLSEDNYAGIGVRYNSSVACEQTSLCGCSVKIYGNGKTEVYFMDKIVSECMVDNLNQNDWNSVKILALANIYMVYLNDKFIGDFEETNQIQASGRISVLSGLYANKFRNLEVLDVDGMVQYANQIDALSSNISYSRLVSRNATDSYKYSNRTSVTLKEGDCFELKYKGYGFALCGTVENAEITVTLDEKELVNKFKVFGTEYRQSFYRIFLEESKSHELKVFINKGSVILDSVLEFVNNEKTISPEIIAKPNKLKINAKTITAAAAATAAIGVSAALVLKKVIKKKK